MIREINGIRRLEGQLNIPSSKSFAQRVLACSLISDKRTVIHGLGISDDEKAILDLIRGAGADVCIEQEQAVIIGSGFHPEGALELNCNESGLGARMMTPILANSSFPVKLCGKGTLLNRTMSIFDEVLPQLDIDFHSNNGRLPFNIQGPLKPKSIEIDGSLSSQFITGIILGFVASPFLRDEVLTVRNPASVPYIELTLEILSIFGIDLQFIDNKISFSGPYEMRETEVTIEGDWSSASFFLIAGAIGGDMTVRGLNIHSKQADVRILDALKDFGAGIEIHSEYVRVYQKDKRPFSFDATHCPDLFPPLAVLASFTNGESRIKGLKRLKFKESDRAATIHTELTKMGAKISFDGDEMVVTGIKEVRGAMIDPHGDHRIAMACSVMGLFADSKTIIDNSQVVNKSFPQFYSCLAENTL